MKQAEQTRSGDARLAIMTAIRQQLAASGPVDAVHEENRVRHETPVAQTATVALHGSLLDRFRQNRILFYCQLVVDTSWPQ